MIEGHGIFKVISKIVQVNSLTHYRGEEIMYKGPENSEKEADETFCFPFLKIRKTNHGM